MEENMNDCSILEWEVECLLEKNIYTLDMILVEKWIFLRFRKVDMYIKEI